MEKRPGFRIKEVHAVLGIGDDDEEGVPAVIGPDGLPIPLVASDRVRLEQITLMAQMVADQTGKSFKIARFSVREDIGEVKPRQTR